MASESSTSITPDVDHRHAYMAAIIVTTVVAVLMAWARLYTRVYVSKNAGWDDWVMFIATFLTIGTNAVLVEAYNLGLGRHIEHVPEAQIPRCFMFLWIAEPTNLFALYAVRVSITLFFLRLIPLHRVFYRRMVWGIIWALTVSDIYVSINYFIQCRPIQKVWDTDLPGTCLSDAAYQAGPWFYQAVSIIADIALMSIPVMMFRTLKLPTRTKVGVILICCLGVFTCACAVVKTALLPELFDHSVQDKTWSLAQLCLWAALEINIGMMCGSIPCLKPLYARLRHGKPVGHSASSGSYQLSDRFAHKAGNAIYRHHDIEHSSGPADPARAESEDSILPRAVTYGQVETRVHGPSSSRSRPGEAL